ncbi:RNA polymerase-associated protein rtf1 [Nowakowskiella sp. JEL0407]|nr:RNA polymerase-associated protein rtf1 [Nowakowskiella sp. JEL0407]
MDSLNARILALAGANSQSSSPAAAKRKRASPSKKSQVSDDESSNQDVSDFDFDDDVDSDVDVRNWGPDLIGDDEDRRKLNAMTDLDREHELYRRKEKVDAWRERQEVRKKLQETEKRSSSSHMPDRRTSSRKSGKERKSVSDLKKEKRRKNDGYDSPYYDHHEEGEMPAAFDSDNEPIIKEEIDAIQVTRAELAKWAHMEIKVKNEWIGFKDIVTDCFVRVGLGLDPQTKQNVYRIARIMDVVDEDDKGNPFRPYSLEGTIVTGRLKVRHGKSDRVFTMDVISNGLFTEGEWERYVTQMKIDKMKMISRESIKRKREDLSRVRDHRMTPEEIDRMVKAKRDLKGITNLTNERLQLRFALEAAVANSNYEQISQLKEKIAKLEKMEEETKKKAEIKKEAPKSAQLVGMSKLTISSSGDSNKPKVPLIPIINKKESAMTHDTISPTSPKPKVEVITNLSPVDDNFLDEFDVDALN